MTRIVKRVRSGADIAGELARMRERERETRVSTALRARGPHEPWHLISAPGEPGFGGGWSNAGPSPARFLKDPSGFVHIAGAVSANSPATFTVFTLPVGYRPEWQAAFALSDYYGTAGYILLLPNGQVEVPVLGGTGPPFNYQLDCPPFRAALS